MTGNNEKHLKAEARLAFEKKDYFLAFQTLAKADISDFVNYGQKEIRENGNFKPNWFTYLDSKDFFWKDFILKEDFFNKLFHSEFAEHILHTYFILAQTDSPELESKLATSFPDLLIKAVRLNQVFLKSEKVESLAQLPLGEKGEIHKKIWKKISDGDLTLWNKIEQELKLVQRKNISDILTYCNIWLETSRFNDNSRKKIHHLVSVYSFFVELLFNKYEGSFHELSKSTDFFKHFIQVISKAKFDKKIVDENCVSSLLSKISDWLIFKEQIISPYCFDLNIEAKQEDELLYLAYTPENHYKWLLNGTRYEIIQLNYLLQGMETVDYFEVEKVITISGKSQHDRELNRKLLDKQWSTFLLMEDLCVESFQLGKNKITIDKLLYPLSSYSFNRLNRYELMLMQFSESSKNWIEAFEKLMLDSIRKRILNEPYFLMSEEEYKELNQSALSELTEDSTEEVIELFGYKSNSKNSFNRLNSKYEVWKKPFLRFGNMLYCPMMFFANNIWFYAFAQAALQQIKTKEFERGETRVMENQFGETIRKKGWIVKIINDKEANLINGDVDIIVEDNNIVLLIQLKRTYFRFNLKDAYYESINTDNKAARQLNDAEKFLENNNSIYSLKQKPIKWIVSTSFENVGEQINSCKKINYFEFLNALKNPEVMQLSQLIADLEMDKNLKRIASIVFDENCPEEFKFLIAETGLPIELFESKSYKYPVFSDEESKTIECVNLYSDALILYNKGRKKEAIILYQKCIILNPDDGELHSAFANTLADLRLFEDAFIAFKKALDLLPNDPFISRNYAIALLQSGNYIDGLNIVIQLFETYPLLGDFKRIFETSFDSCIKQGLLNKSQIVELQDRWNSLN